MFVAEARCLHYGSLVARGEIGARVLRLGSSCSSWFGRPGALECPCGFEGQRVGFCKGASCSSAGATASLWGRWGDAGILTLPRLPVHEHGMSLHFISGRLSFLWKTSYSVWGIIFALFGVLLWGFVQQ